MSNFPINFYIFSILASVDAIHRQLVPRKLEAYDSNRASFQIEFISFRAKAFESH
jgi:hypothetical protein